MSDQSNTAAPMSAEAVAEELSAYLSERFDTPVGTDHDLFASGLVSSIFAMELVSRLEKTYRVDLRGPDLKLDNFRTADRMGALVHRLRGASGDV